MHSFVKKHRGTRQLKTCHIAALALFSILLVILAGCEKDHCLDCFKSTGKIITEDRMLEPFTSMQVSDLIQINIIQDTVNMVTVEAGKNLIPGIVTEVSEGKLTIRNDNLCNWVRSYKKDIILTLHCRKLSMIYYDGAGTIQSLNTLNSDTLELNFWSGSGLIKLDVNSRLVLVHMHTGPADAELSGKTDLVHLYCRGNGQARCSNLIAGSVGLDWKATNDCYVHATQEIHGTIEYIGNVYYSGNPSQINVTATERGQLIPLY